MAGVLQSTSSYSILQPRNRVVSAQSSLSFASKSNLGLKSHSTGSYGFGNPRQKVEFDGEVYKGLQSRSRDNPTRVHYYSTPMVPYRTPGEGSRQWIDVTNALYRERVIFISEDLDEWSSNQLLLTMLYLDMMDSNNDLLLFINSDGGDLSPMLAVYDTMKSLTCPIATRVLGHAYNLGCFLVAAGDKGKRAATPFARFSLQAPAGSARGRADDVNSEATELLRIRDYLFSELAKNTGQPLEKIYKDLERKKHFHDAQAAKDYGIIDHMMKLKEDKHIKPRKDA